MKIPLMFRLYQLVMFGSWLAFFLNILCLSLYVIDHNIYSLIGRVILGVGLFFFIVHLHKNYDEEKKFSIRFFP